MKNHIFNENALYVTGDKTSDTWIKSAQSEIKKLKSNYSLAYKLCVSLKQKVSHRNMQIKDLKQRIKDVLEITTNTDITNILS